MANGWDARRKWASSRSYHNGSNKINLEIFGNQANWTGHAKRTRLKVKVKVKVKVQVKVKVNVRGWLKTNKCQFFHVQMNNRRGHHLVERISLMHQLMHLLGWNSLRKCVQSQITNREHLNMRKCEHAKMWTCEHVNRERNKGCAWRKKCKRCDDVNAGSVAGSFKASKRRN